MNRTIDDEQFDQLLREALRATPAPPHDEHLLERALRLATVRCAGADEKVHSWRSAGRVAACGAWIVLLVAALAAMRLVGQFIFQSDFARERTLFASATSGNSSTAHSVALLAGAVLLVSVIAIAMRISFDEPRVV